jgi:hypothetical protein
MFKKHLISDPWKRALPDIEAELLSSSGFPRFFGTTTRVIRLTAPKDRCELRPTTLAHIVAPLRDETSKCLTVLSLGHSFRSGSDLPQEDTSPLPRSSVGVPAAQDHAGR